MKETLDVILLIKTTDKTTRLSSIQTQFEWENVNFTRKSTGDPNHTIWVSWQVNRAWKSVSGTNIHIGYRSINLEPCNKVILFPQKNDNMDWICVYAIMFQVIFLALPQHFVQTCRQPTIFLNNAFCRCKRINHLNINFLKKNIWNIMDLILLEFVWTRIG